MPRTRPPYPPEFRREAVRLVRSSGRPISEAARELGVSHCPHTQVTIETDRRKIVEGLDERLIWQHIRKAQTTLKGENQLAEYVAQLEIAECASILAASPISLPLLAARRDECRVGPDEERSFEEVIRAWTLEVLSGLEGG